MSLWRVKKLAAALVIAAMMCCVSHYQNGHTAIDNGDYDTAIAEFTEEIRWNTPNAEEARSYRGVAYLRRAHKYAGADDFDRAIADFESARDDFSHGSDKFSEEMVSGINGFIKQAKELKKGSSTGQR